MMHLFLLFICSTIVLLGQSNPQSLQLHNNQVHKDKAWRINDHRFKGDTLSKPETPSANHPTHFRYARQGDQIGFTAILSSNLQTIEDETIRCDEVLVNVGSMYDKDLGAFYCSDDELYMFVWTLQSPVPSVGQYQAKAKLMHQDRLVKYGPVTRLQYLSNGEGFSGSSQMAVVAQCIEQTAFRLSAGRWSEDEWQTEYNSTYTSFSGFRVTSHEDDVAFHAELSQDLSVHHNQLILFDNATINVGNAYDPNIGAFLCPDDGIYFFTITLQALAATKASVQLILDEKDVLVVQGPITYRTHRISDVPNSGTSSSSVVLQCIPDKYIYVHSIPVESNEFNQFQAQVTSFSGIRVDASAAFSVQLTTNITAEEDVNIPYDNIILNEGGYFNPQGSIFQCPDEEAYFLTWTIHVDRHAVNVELVLGGLTLREGPYTTYVDDTSQGTSGSVSMSTIVKCNQGGSLSVRVQEVIDPPVQLVPWLNYFSGFRLPRM